MKKQITLFFALMVVTMLSANNLTVTNIELTGQNLTNDYTMVQFDISWENSWRNDLSGAGQAEPYNWDAAWVFLKYRVTEENGGDGQWYHARISKTGHIAPAGSTIIPSADDLGVFIYRSTNGTGTNNFTNVQILWNYNFYSIPDNALIDLQVIAIEMVYLPQGSFEIGSGGSESGTFYKYPTTTNTFTVSNEDAITVGTAADNLYYPSSTYGGDQTGPLPEAFSKGYDAFYCMKYEISQQEYVDFLNTLYYVQQEARTGIAPNSPAEAYLYNTNRNKIKISSSGIATTTPAIYETVYPHVACNYLSWADVAAYLDWCGLRPMTELEFEKACRGTLPAVANEYAWGTTGIATSDYTLSNSGADNEAIATNYSTTVGNAAYSLTTPIGGSINGPLRTGIFAGTTGNTGRVTSGATYYGIMEMSGNLWERPVTVGNATGRAYTGNYGDGYLDWTTGNADVTDWPGTDAVGAGFRGGGWSSANTELRVSDRYYATYAGSVRSSNWGGRGVRSAPFYIGQSYGGGIIFQIDYTLKHGFIVATSDQSAGAEWGCEDIQIGTYFNGQINTTLIVNGCSTPGIAARLCDQYAILVGGIIYDDWFLPSNQELLGLWQQRDAVGGLAGDTYWSSEECGIGTAFALDVAEGLFVSGAPKHWPYYVRAIRAF